MSRRQIRKITGSNILPPPDSGSEDDCCGPSFREKTTTQSLYAGLELSSESNCSESESEPSSSDHESQKNTVKGKKTPKHKKKSNNKCNDKEDDIIEKTVKEINALLGAPPPAPTTSDTKEEDPFQEIFSIEARNLDIENELKRLFGSDNNRAQSRRKPQRTKIASKKIHIVSTENFEYHGRIGLSMSVVNRANNITYFAFDHSPEYQKRHRLYLSLPTNYVNTIVEDVLKLHVESHLEVADVLFEVEEYSNAYTIVEYVIGMMQLSFHPLFNLNSNIRLEYQYLENRPFHLALLKYIYLVSNKACHRTALELAKFLLRLDPTDPMAVIFVIDSIALRAREHEWLISASDYWIKSSAAGYLMNIIYSRALATFHIAVKKKDDLSAVDDLLKNAILQFPTVMLLIKEMNKDAPNGMAAHDLFTKAQAKTNINLVPLIKLYGKLSSARWREPAVAEWVNRNIKAIMEEYKQDPRVKEKAEYYNARRISLFRGTPVEVKRHLSAIQAMSHLVLDGAVSQSVRMFREPLTGGVNRYNYVRQPADLAPINAM